jgi:hypothetical protein
MLLLLFAAPKARAEQTHYQVDRGTLTWSFELRWTDHKGKERAASFRLPRAPIELDLKEPLRFPIREATRSVVNDVKAWAETELERVRLQVWATGDGGIRMRAHSTDAKAARKALKRAAEVRDLALARVLDQHGFVMLDRGIAPDHATHAVEYAAALEPLVEALGGSLRIPRRFANRALSFVQSIPYERASLKKDRYRRPLSLLGRNRGDCDSKATLFLALMRQAYPDIDTALFYIREHALVGLNLEPKAEDTTLRANGRTWVLAEPVGPREVAVGKIDKRSKRRLKARRFDIVVIEGEAAAPAGAP